MESESPAAARLALREAERAAAAPYLDYPPRSSWFAPVAGLWVAGLAAAVVYLNGHWWSGAVLGALIVAGGRFEVLHRRRRRTRPNFRKPPCDFRPVVAFYVVGMPVITATVIATSFLAPAWSDVLLAFSITTVYAAIYRWCYARAAHALRARLQ